MAITAVSSSYRPQTGGQMLDFFMSLLTLEEKKEFRKLQEKYAKMAKEQLGLEAERLGISREALAETIAARGQRGTEFAAELREKKKGRRQYGRLMGRQLDVSESELSMAEELHRAGIPIRKEAAVTARGRTRIKKNLLLTDRKIAEAQRKYDVAKAYGNVATQATAARALKVLKDSKRDAPIPTEWAIFADEKGKEQTAENQLLRQQVFSANQGMQTLELMLKQQNMRGQARLKGITDAVKTAGSAGWESVVSNIDRILDPNANIADIVADISRETAAGRGEIAETARMGKWIDPSKFTKAERDKFDPQSLAQYEDAFRNTGRGVETMTIARPKSEKRWYWFDNTEMTLTRKRAVEIGVGDLWDAAKSKEIARGQTPTKPVTPISVKGIINEKAKKTKPAGTKAAKKLAGKETRGGYTVGQIIEAGGRRWKVTGFDTDGEPLVTEIK